MDTLEWVAPPVPPEALALPGVPSPPRLLRDASGALLQPHMSLQPFSVGKLAYNGNNVKQ